MESHKGTSAFYAIAPVRIRPFHVLVNQMVSKTKRPVFKC